MNATITPTPARLEIRNAPHNPNHHLWLNNGIWWCHITLKPANAPTFRKRFSLKTNDLDAARNRRDRIIQDFQLKNVVL